MKNVSYLLIKASRYLKSNLDQALKPYGVTASQFSVLNQVASENGHITSAEVANVLDYDRPTVSGITLRLEKKGLLEKIDNPKDKRSAYLKLNDKALTLVKELRIVADQLNNVIFEGFDEEELNNLNEYLGMILEKVDNI